jgi:hypothetical protein
MRSTCGTVAGPAEDQAPRTQEEQPAGEHGRRRGRPARAAQDATIQEAREARWLYDFRSGQRIAEIARHERLSPGWIRSGLARAREREFALQSRESRLRDNARMRDRSSQSGTVQPLRETYQAPVLVPLFPIEPFTPHSTCPHHGPIRPGSVFCCMVCNQSGMEDHPALKRDPRTDPRPEPIPVAPPRSPSSGTRKTRKQRRSQSREARQVAPAASRDPRLLRAG